MQKQKKSIEKRDKSYRRNSATVGQKSLTRISAELERLFSSYKRHGGKKNRKQQFLRIKKVVEWVYHAHKVESIEQIGKTHIIDFYRSHRNEFSDTTLMRGYYPAIKIFYEITGKHNPPKPYKKNK